MSTQDLEAFKDAFLERPALQDRLKATRDTSSFIALAVQLGRESGYNFTPQEVEKQIIDYSRSPKIGDESLNDSDVLDLAISICKTSTSEPRMGWP